MIWRLISEGSRKVARRGLAPAVSAKRLCVATEPDLAISVVLRISSTAV
jgi:hypothetical protein